MKRIALDELLKKTKDLSYTEQYQRILQLIEEGRIRPLKASGTNGKKPALYLEYWLTDEEDGREKGKLLNELAYDILPAISIDYYRKHPTVYKEDRQWVLLLNQYLKEHRDRLKVPVSLNERSFDIWHREKFLSKEQGRSVLKRCGLTIEDLNVYQTLEPFSYYVRSRETPQNILILENKDTFYSMRRALMNGTDKLLGVSIDTLVYGAGKGIWGSFREFELCAEPYMKQDNTFLYFGDLDYEGILIYERLVEIFKEQGQIRPFVEAYEKMLAKQCQLSKLPETKEGQNRNVTEQFFSYFGQETVKQICSILEAGRYIPQEILNIQDYGEK